MIKFMRMLVFFDLPVKTRIERKIATRFRKHLLKDGFYMIQFSIYCRICAGYDIVSKHTLRLKRNLPPKGSVRLLTVTEKQYSKMEFLVGKKMPNDKNIRQNQISFF